MIENDLLFPDNVPKIDKFDGEFRYLSNFAIYPTEYEGILFPTSEHAYQASKSLIIEERKTFLLPQNKEPGKAKHLGRKLTLRPHWDGIKNDVMLVIVQDKFNRHLDIRQKLIDTAPAELIESNFWHDKWYGVCTCEKCNGKGLNWLGRILMKVREDLINKII